MLWDGATDCKTDVVITHDFPNHFVDTPVVHMTIVA